MPIYEYNGKRYDIPEAKIDELVTRMPGAKLIEHDAPDREITETVQQHEQQPVQQPYEQQPQYLNTLHPVSINPNLEQSIPARGSTGLETQRSEADNLDQPVPKNAAQEQEGFWATRVGDFFEKVGSGAVNLAGGFAKVHENTNPFMLAARKIAGVLQAEEGTSIKDAEMVQDGIPKALMEKGKDLSERGDRYGNIEDPETGEIRKKTYSDLWKEGRKGAAVEEALLTASESIPTSLMAFAPGGLGLIAITVAGQTYEELDTNPETKDLPEWKKILNASLTGVIEGATEKLGAKVDVKLIEPFMKKMTEKTVKQILAKGGINALIQALSEGAEEVVSQLGGNIVDYATGVSDTYKPFEGVKDSFVYGIAGGAQFGGVTMSGSAYRATQQHQANIQAAKQQNSQRLWNSINNKQSVALPNLNKEKQQLEAELGDLVGLTFEEVANSPESTPELIEAKRRHDIVNAEYEGVMEKLKAEVDEFIAPQIKAVEDIAVDGQITELNIGTEEVQDIVYLAKGDIGVNEDGTVDTDNTAPILIVTDSEGKRRMVSRSKISSVKMDDLRATVEAIRQQAFEKFVRPLADKMEDNARFKDGQQVEYINDKGKVVAGTVATQQNGTVTVVSNDGKKTETLTANQLASQLITESIDDVKVRDVIQVEIDGEIYEANVTSIQDGKAELYIPSFPEANVRYQDVTTEELRKIRVVPQAEDIKKTEEEVKSGGIAPVQVVQNDSITPEIESGSQITPEQLAEQEKQTFIQSLPVVESGKRKGQIDQSQMTPEQNIKYFEYQYGQEKAIEASQKMVQTLNDKIVSEQKKLEEDPFNIELNENIQAMQGQLQSYKAYADAQQQQQEQQPQEQEQVEQQPQQQEQGVEQEVQREEEQKLTTEEKARLRREQSERLAEQKKELRAQRREEAKVLAEQDRLRIEKEIEAEQNDPNLSKAEKEVRRMMRQADTEKEELRNKFRKAKPSERESLWGDVQSLREHIMRELIKGQKILWGDSKGSKGFAHHLGLKGSESERRKYIGLLGSVQKTNAKTPEQLADNVWQNVAFSETDPFFGVDTMEILGEVLDILYTYTSKGQMIKALDSDRLDNAFAQIDDEVNMAINDLESRQEESPVDVEEVYGQFKANEMEGVRRDISDKEYDLYYKDPITFEEFEEQIRNFKENFSDYGYEEELGSDREAVEQGSEAPIGEGRDNRVRGSQEDQGGIHKVPENRAEGRVESSEEIGDREDDQSGESKNAQGPIGRAEGNLDGENERRVEGKEDELNALQAQFKEVKKTLKDKQKAYDAAYNKYLDLRKKAEKDPLYGMRGQGDAFGGVAGQDNMFVEQADDINSDIRKIISNAKQESDRLGEELNAAQKEADRIEEAIFDMRANQQVLFEGEQEKKGSEPADIVKEAQQAVEKYKQESYKKEASRLSEMFGVDAEVHENLDGVSKDVRKQIESGGRTPGWYQNGKVHIYLPHTISVKDLQQTFFHEVIAHKGLRELLGDRFNDVMLDFFDKLPKEVQTQLLSRYKSFDVYANKADQELRVIAADEFIASVAENGEFMGVDQRTVLQRIIDAIKKIFNANNIEVRLADVERLANDYLKQSAENLQNKNNPRSQSSAEDIAFRSIQDNNKLVALHNISADNLIKVSRIGGFSMPSIAITKPEISFQQYGEITLIGNKDMIDPKIKANKVYGADAYTTRYPSISYEVKNTNPIKEMVSKMPIDNGILGELLYDINKDGDAYLYENRDIRLMFAHQKGADIFKTVKTDIAKPVIDFVREVEGYDHLSIRDNEDVKTKLGKIIADNLSDKHKKIYERVGLLENGVAPENLINDTFDAAKEYIRKEGQVDAYQSYINAREYINNNNLEEEIKRFARDLYEQLDVTERIFKGYTKNGTPRYVPHTLENVLKEMKSNKGVGIEGLSGNFGQIRARLVPEFKSIKGIKDKAHTLADNRVSEEEFNKVLEQYYEISGKLEKYHKWGDDWLDTRRSFNDEIISLVRNGESESFKNLPKDLQEEIKTFAANVENIPTDYFEAKPERAIGIGEFSSAVVPKGTDQRVIDALTDSGVSVHEYTDSSDRMEVVKKVSDENDLMFRTVNEENSILSKSKNRGGKNSPTVQTQINWEAEVGNVPARRNEAVSADTSMRELQQQRGYDPDIDNRVTHVERLLENKGPLNFMGSPLTGGATIKGANDVAFLFKNLESASSENTFVVFANNKGQYSVLYHTTGATAGSIVDMKMIVTAAKDFKADKMWFVHNHPSGSLRPSPQDKEIHRKLQTLGPTVGVRVQPSIIINLDSGKYVEFIHGDYTVKDKEEVKGEAAPVNVYSFDRQKLYTPSSEKTQITSQRDVAEFLSKQKRGTVDKTHVLILDQQNRINRYFLVDSSVDEIDTMQLIAPEVGRSGESIILASNSNLSGVLSLKDVFKDLGINVLDVMQIKQIDDIVNGYESVMEDASTYDRGAELRFRFIGEIGASRAEGAEKLLDNLSVAREMETKGKDAKNIRLATGWERGADGKWRYEVEDIKLSFNDFADIYRKTRPTVASEIKAFQDSEIVKQYPELNKTYIQFIETSGYDGGYGKGSYDDTEGTPSIVFSRQLYKDYQKEVRPIHDRLLEILKIQKFGYPEQSAENAKQSGKELTSVEELNQEEINLRNNLKEIEDKWGSKLNSIFLHELQHAIQEIEGFAKGGDINKGRDLYIDNIRAPREKDAFELRGLWKKVEQLDAYKEYQKFMGPYSKEAESLSEEDWLKKEKELGDAYFNTEEYKAFTKKNNEFGQKYNVYPGNVIDPDWAAKETQTQSFDHYKRLSGEVEARNVQRRMDLDADSRRQTLLQETEDIAREDQIILFRALEQSNQELPYTINIDGIERSTTNSEGNPIAQTEEGVRNFWKWFGDSKVVDNEGRPLVVYHATNENFTTFDKELQGTNTDDNNTSLGFFFTTKENLDVLKSQNEGQFGDTEMPVYLKIDEPLDIRQNAWFNNHETAQVIAEIAGEELYGSDAIEYVNENIDIAELSDVEELLIEYKDFIIEKGYDGFISDMGNNTIEYIVPESNQIKSADNNTGSFDPNSNDIRFRALEDGSFPGGLNQDGLYTEVSYIAEWSNAPSKLIGALEDYYKGELIGISRRGREAIEQGDLVPIPDRQHTGEQGEYHHISFRNRDTGEIEVKAVPFVNIENVEDRTGIRFRSIDQEAREAYAMREWKRGINALTKLSKRLNVDVEILETTEGLTGRKSTAKGWFDPKTGKITIVMPNHSNSWDVQSTLLHEAVGHYGLRELFGDNFYTFLDNVYNASEKDIRDAIDNLAKKYKGNRRTATEEYLSQLAEDPMLLESDRRGGFFDRVRRFFMNMLAKAGFNPGFELSNNELRYILWRSYSNLAEPGRYKSIVDHAKDIAMQDKLKIGNYAMNAINKVAEGTPLFRSKEATKQTRKADQLFENIDNLKTSINDYSGFLGRVLDGATNKTDIISKAKEKGFDKLGEAIEEYLSNVEDPTELNRVKELLGVDMPDNALRYMLWRNANPNDGSVVWKAKDAVKTRELDDNVLFRTGKDFSKAKLNEYESRVRGRHNGGFRSLLYGIEEGWFDRMASLRILQEAITGKKTFKDKENAYMYENQLSSRNTADVRHYTQKIVDPLIEQVQKVFGRDLSAADNYMNAKHGLERNKHMAREEAERKHTKQKEELNQLLEDGDISEDDYNIQMELVDESIDELTEELIETKDYSGLTALAEERDREDFTQNAMDMVMEIEGRISKEDIDALWEHVNNATKWTIQKQYNSGMMSKDTYEKINTMYEYYVPLRGFSELTATDIYDYMLNPPSIFEGTLKKAYGRTSKAESPTATILTMGESGIMQANRNRMKQAFYRLVATNPSNYASIEDVWYVKSGNDWQEKYPEISPTATAEETIEAIAEFNNEMAELSAEGQALQGRAKLDVGVKILKAQTPEHIVKVHIAGEEKLIFINGNPRAAQAINGLLQKDLLKKDNLRHGVEYWSRQMSANFTSRNPAFMVTNLMRDVQFAVISAAVKEGAGYSANLSKNILKVGKTIGANVFGDGNKKNTEYQKYWEEFESNGGETGYANLNSIDYNRKYVNKKLREFSDQRDFIKPFRAYTQFMENGNRTIEDMSRFATYVTSRQDGRSIERSVSDAKEITINFNRKGSGIFLAKAAHSFYLFSNPAIQSMRLLGMLAKNHPIRFTAMLSSTMAAGFMVPMINEMLLGLFGDDDDKEKYQNITPWVRRNNLVMYVPGTDGKFVTLMLPHELRAFYGIGEMAYEKANGGLRHENMVLETGKQLFAMAPIDPMSGPDWWVPDAAKPLYQAHPKINRNFMGSPIYRSTPWNKLDPEWTKAYKRTPELLVEAAKGASDMTGGDDVVPGSVNLNPARAYHIFSGYLGGSMTTYTDLSMIAFNLLTGRDVTANDIPVVNKLIRTSDEDTKDMRINSEYFYYVDWINEYEHRLKGYEKRLNDPEYAEKYRDIVTDDEMQMYNYAKGQMEMIKNTQELNEDLSKEQKEEFVRQMWEYEDRLKD